MTDGRLDIWLVVVLAVAAGQLVKLAAYSLTQRRLRPAVLAQSAGLPSAHAMCAGSLVGAVALRTGWSSAASGAALVFAAIMVFDAMRVRSAADAQRRLLRELVLLEDAVEPWQRRVVGYLDAMNHAPAHVAVGLVWGFLFALACGTA
ncbi:MAG: divergent PAP2 family protein [Candidatus Krumholzibacteriia bacterium]